MAQEAESNGRQAVKVGRDDSEGRREFAEMFGIDREPKYDKDALCRIQDCIAENFTFEPRLTSEDISKMIKEPW